MSAADKPNENANFGAPSASPDTSLSKGSNEGSIDSDSKDLTSNDRGQQDDLVGVVLGIGLAVIVGFFILYMANETMTMMNLSESDPLYPAYETLNQTTNDVFSWFSLVFFAVLISIALAYLWRIRGR